MTSFNLVSLSIFSVFVLSHGCAQTDTSLQKQYGYIERDGNQHPIVLGESYKSGIKNGEWRRYNPYEQIVSVEQYLNDTLSGINVFYHYPNPGQVYREEGWMEKGKRVSIWTVLEVKTNKKRTARKVSYLVYGTDEQITAKFLLHPNGRIALEMIYNHIGEVCWYRSYSKSGKLLFEGADLPLFYEIRN